MTGQTRVRHRSVALVATGILGLPLLLGTAVTGGVADSVVYSARYIPFAPIPGDCFLCDICSGSGHVVIERVTAIRLGPDHICQAQSNCETHGHVVDDSCGYFENGESRPSVEDLWRAVVAARGAELADVIEQNGEVVDYNEARSAIQIKDCKGPGIIASIQLTRDQVASLSEVVDE